MTDFDERDPFPEASVPAPAADAPAAGAPGSPHTGPQPTADREAAVPLAGPPEPSAALAAATDGAAGTAGATEGAAGTAGATERAAGTAGVTQGAAGTAGIPPSEAPTLPLIPVERLRFQTAPPGDAALAPPAPEDAPSTEALAEAAPKAASPAPAPSAASAAPPRPTGPALAERSPAPAAPLPTPPLTPMPIARDLIDRRQPLYRECRGYRLRLDPPDLARLRELPGSRGKSDDEIGEAFFDGQADRLAASIAGDVPTPSEVRVVVDPYSRQAFLALENRIRGILSF
jgi:hypothetical protein